MLKSMLLVAVFTLLISFGSIPASAQTKIDSIAPSSGVFASPTTPSASATLAISQIFVGDINNSRSSSWFATFAPSRSMMLVFGACLLLFGAFLRRRPALRRPESRPVPLSEKQNESAMNVIPETTTSMVEQIKTASPLVTGPSTDRPKPEILPAFLATHRSLADPAISKEHQ
jgi:hypothetical protein